MGLPRTFQVLAITKGRGRAPTPQVWLVLNHYYGWAIDAKDDYVILVI